MKNTIIDDLVLNNKTGSKTREVYIKKHYYEAYEEIVKINFTDNWNEKLYVYVNNFNEIPICENSNCKNTVHFKKYSEGYYKYCSISCKNSDSKNKLIGKKNPMKNPVNVKKAKETKKIKYGDENFINLEKAKETKKIKYGDEYYTNREKAKETSLEKYNHENYTNREKAKQTSLEKYGDEFYNNSEKRFKTNMNKYGQKIFNNREKAKQTSLEKYGETSFLKTEEHRNNVYLNSIKKTSKKLGLNINMLNFNGNEYIVSGYCKTHNHFNINKYVLKNRLLYKIENLCTICNPVSKNSSIKEIELREFIKSLNIPFIENDRKILDGKEIDIFIPNYNVGIEFNGLYWHSNIKISKNSHLDKTNDCENQGIKLLHVFENEWMFKKNIVKSIIKCKLGLLNNKIYARKTEIKKIIDNQLIREFLNTNHIQGFVGSKVKIGLFYEDELVSLMTFGKKRIVMGNKENIDGDYEMLRFCNKLNTQVIGGASKLLKYFINNYHPNSILTFADRRYSNGSLYQQLGFEFVGNTEPNYWYFKSHEYVLYHRFNFRKDILVKEGYNKNKTEKEIMIERKFYSIYDSGNKKYILRLE